MPKEPRTVSFSLGVRLIKVGSGYIAAGSMAGMTFRGTRQETKTAAMHALFYQFTHGNNDAELALDLAVNGEDYTVIESDLSAAAKELESGSEGGKTVSADSADED